MYFRSGVVAAVILSMPAAAQSSDIERLTEASRVLPSRNCQVEANPGDIVVCGRNRQDRFRIPEELRGIDAPMERSWTSQAEDFLESERTAGQTVGPSGALKFTQQMAREWRAERAQIEREKRAVERALDEQ